MVANQVQHNSIHPYSLGEWKRDRPLLPPQLHVDLRRTTTILTPAPSSSHPTSVVWVAAAFAAFGCGTEIF